MVCIHRWHVHGQRASLLAKVQAPHTRSHLDLLMLSAFFTGRPLTQDNFFPTEVPPAPTSAPACCFSYPLPPPWDLNSCHWVLLCARCQAFSFGRRLGSGRQQAVQEGARDNKLAEISCVSAEGLPCSCTLYMPPASGALGPKLAFPCKLLSSRLKGHPPTLASFCCLFAPSP